MDEILSATVDSRNGIVLDPRTKLFMLITITTLMFSTSNHEYSKTNTKPYTICIDFVRAQIQNSR